jgi:hypothetical protein
MSAEITVRSRSNVKTIRAITTASTAKEVFIASRKEIPSTKSVLLPVLPENKLPLSLEDSIIVLLWLTIASKAKKLFLVKRLAKKRLAPNVIQKKIAD